MRSTIRFESVDVPVFATSMKASSGAPAACGRVAEARALDRVGIEGVSRTTAKPNSSALGACDWTPDSGWCGRSVAHRRPGVPLDPRLTMTCRDRDGRPLGFLWVEPQADASYVVVSGHRFAQAYRVVQRQPVRVTTNAVDVQESTATARVSQHARDGSLLSKRTIEAQVSG